MASIRLVNRRLVKSCPWPRREQGWSPPRVSLTQPSQYQMQRRLGQNRTRQRRRGRRTRCPPGLALAALCHGQCQGPRLQQAGLQRLRLFGEGDVWSFMHAATSSVWKKMAGGGRLRHVYLPTAGLPTSFATSARGPILLGHQGLRPTTLCSCTCRHHGWTPLPSPRMSADAHGGAAAQQKGQIQRAVPIGPRKQHAWG